MKNETTLEKKIEKIKKELMAIGEMHPGSLSMQYNICGNPKCRCKDPENPKKHGPYHQLSYVHKGKSTSRFIKLEFLPTVKKQVANYAKFKILVEEWKSLATELAKLKIDLANEKMKKRTENP